MTTDPKPPNRRPTARSPSILLGLVILLGVAVRLFLLLQWPRRLNADEATVGLMGLHILRGEFPVFFDGQGYLGALEAYLTAVVYVVAGVSTLTVKVIVFLLSCLFIVISFLLGKRIAGWSGGLTCALLTALAPPFLPVFGNYPMLGYVEVVVVGSLILLLTLDLVTDERGGAPRERRLLVLALLAGLGWWINPMILSYVAAAGVFLLRPRLWSRRAPWAVPLAFLLASLPFWIFNVTHAFWSFALFERSGLGGFTVRLQKTFSRLLEITGVGDMFLDPIPWLSPAAGAVYLGLLGVLLVDLARRNPGPAADTRVQRRGVQLLLLFSLLHLVAFLLHRFATLGGTQRYLFPLYSSLAVLTGIALLRVWGWSRLLAAGAVIVLLLNNSLALGRTVRFFEDERQRDWWKPDPTLAWLRSEGLTRGYAGFWELGPLLTFEAQERIVVADPFEQRYPPYREWVDASPRVAYVLARRHGLLTTRFESGLEGIGASYRRKDFGEFFVFSDFAPPADGALASLPPVGWRAEGNPSGSDPARAFDRDAESAWLSEKSLAPGMWYRLDLGRVVTLGGITALPVRAGIGIPKGYRIELSRDGTKWEAVASVPEFEVTLRWRGGQPRMDRSGHLVSRFAPRPVRYVRITQTGKDRTERWAIAELFVYEPARGPAGDRREAPVHLREGLRLEAAARWGAALAAYERAVRLDPEWEEAHWRMAEVYEKAGLPPDGTDPYRRGLVFERLGMEGRALGQYERLLRQPHEDGQHSDFLSRLLELYARRGDKERAALVERRLRDDYVPPTRADVRFGRSARLLGYDLEPREPRAGEVVTLSYYWQTLTAMTEDFSVAVHFARGRKIFFGQDHEPLHGRYPTSQWKAGELVRESYRVRLPETLPPGEYDLRIGLWNAATRKHLRVEETALPHDSHETRLATIRVLPPR